MLAGARKIHRRGPKPAWAGAAPGRAALTMDYARPKTGNSLWLYCLRLSMTRWALPSLLGMERGSTSLTFTETVR